jgi:ABC-type phosphate/phosphonate transport system substrate-binding protein
MFAALPMYDFTYIRGATDGFWRAMGVKLGVEGGLDRSGDFRAQWQSPDLIFGQACGYPLTHELRGKVKYVATPHYEADGCEGALYRSLVFAREPVSVAALRGKVAAVNSPDSMSGMLALKAVIARYCEGQRFFASTVWTGSHIASLQALQDGIADVCAIDCVTVAHVKRSTPQLLQGLHEIARSPLVPGLPFISNGDAEPVRRALQHVFNDPSADEMRRSLLFKGYSVLPTDAYEVIPALERQVGSIAI